MPELPDITVYVEHVARRVVGARLEGAGQFGPNVLRTVVPPVDSAFGRRVTGVRRVGKRIVLAFEGGLFLVLHLMIAGRLHWRAIPDGEPIPSPGPRGLVVLRFDTGVLSVTEAGTKKRAGMWLVEGEAALAALDPGGLEPLTATVEEFAARLASENHTLKRALTDPRLFSGIGNAYSDEILHHARLSPLRLTHKLTKEEVARLHASVRHVLAAWTERLRAAAGERFPERVTAFREGMAVHGRYRAPCPVCGTPVQRIAYADNETNYCPRCQTEGRLLADRGLSRLLRDDWPRTIEELEEGRAARQAPLPPPPAPGGSNKRTI